MTDYSTNNKTVSDEIRKENNRTYQNNVVVVSFSLFVREATQRILPYPPYSFHFFSKTPNLDSNHNVTIVHPITYHIIQYPAVLPNELHPPFHSSFS
jgi:hypothetical protein